MRGFTLVELIVVVALISLLAVLVLFDGGSSRDRHRATATYGILDAALSQSAILSRSQQEETNESASTYWVVDNELLMASVFQDGAGGIDGVFDSQDVLREQYDLDGSVEIVQCAEWGSGCSEFTQIIVSRLPGDPLVTGYVDGQPVLPLYLRVDVRGQTHDFMVNELGIIES